MAPVHRALAEAAADRSGLRGAAGGDRAPGARANMRLFAADLRATGELRADLTDDEVADVVWSMNAAEYRALLVGGAGLVGRSASAAGWPTPGPGSCWPELGASGVFRTLQGSCSTPRACRRPRKRSQSAAGTQRAGRFSRNDAMPSWPSSPAKNRADSSSSSSKSSSGPAPAAAASSPPARSGHRRSAPPAARAPRRRRRRRARRGRPAHRPRRSRRRTRCR